MSKAVGDGSQYFDSPWSKAHRITHFLQGVTEDFMAIQNLERNDDATTVSTDSTFRQFEIYDA